MTLQYWLLPFLFSWCKIHNVPCALQITECSRETLPQIPQCMQTIGRWNSYKWQNKISLTNYLGFSFFSVMSNHFYYKVEFSVIMKCRERENHCLKRKKLYQAAPSLWADLRWVSLDVSNFILALSGVSFPCTIERFLGARKILHISFACAELLPQ